MNLSTKSYGDPKHKAIVFLHGLGVSSWMWTEQVEALQSEFYCLTIDLPGNGESYQVPWHSFADTATQVATVIRERIAGGRAHLVGLSLGGYTALAILRDHPDTVRSVLVSGVSPRPLSNPGLNKLMVRLAAPLNHVDFFVDLTARAMRLPNDARMAMRRDSKRLSTDTLMQTYDEVLKHELAPELRQRTQPVLAVAGDAEVKAILDHLADYPRTIPGARAYRVPKAQHAWNAEHPQLFTEMVRAWVSGSALPDALIPVNA